MGRSLVIWGVWLGFILYVLVVAPPLQPDTLQPLQTLLMGRIPAINPVLVALFSLVGIWLLIYSCLIFPDGRMQALPAWLFMVGAIAAGVIALIPYLALRQSHQSFSGEKDPWLAILDAQTTGVILTISTIVLVLYAVIWGDWSAFAQAFATDKFVHSMSLAFVLFCVLFPYPTLLKDDAVRRGLTLNSQLLQIATWIPLFGPLAYLCVRPALLAFQFGNS